MSIIRWAVRLVMLAAALGLAFGGPLPTIVARFVPGLSPLAAVASSIVHRRWYVVGFWIAPPAIILLAGLWRGRVFCRWVCPLGTIYSIPSRLSLRKPILKIRLSAYLFWTILLGSAVGTPLVLFLDPLATFGRFGPLLKGTYTVASLIPGVLVPLFLLLGLVQPMIWCTHVCPLGHFLELCQSARRRPAKAFSATRRGILGGLLVGVPLAVVTRKFLLAKKDYGKTPILPLGAKDLENFAAACTRCYACVDACPTKIIRVGFELDRALGQFFQPEVVYFSREDKPDWGYCPESCNRCSRMCAAGALTELTFADKWRRQIGLAKVIKKACLAWEDGEICVVCQEACPYHAIELDYSKEDVPRPVVKEDLCRGCGECQNKCPAIRAGKAIIVEGVRQQRQLVVEDEPPRIAE